MVGVLGGMGPLATVDFLHKLVTSTPADSDQQQVPILVRFCPEVPDRVAALLDGGPSPEPALVAAARALERGGAAFLAMPCNTAHAWYDAVAAAVSIPFLHIVDTALDEVERLGAAGAVGLLATAGTRRSAIYASRGGPATRWLESTDDEQSRWVAPGIRAIKNHRNADGAALLRHAAEVLIARGARAVVMGCTEIPIGLAGQDLGVPLVDPTLALARACVARAGNGATERPAAGAVAAAFP